MNQKSDKTNQGISMLKICLLSFALLLSPLLSAAPSGPLTYEDFVHLSEKEKDQFVIKTMELMVRLENAYRNDPRTLNLSQEEEKKFTLLLKRLKGKFFIDDAYAYQPNPNADREWNKTANDFRHLLVNSSDQKKCIFAGWISKTSGELGRNTLCAHPRFLTPRENDSPEGRAYLDSPADSECSRGGRDKILCNPLIFGYKTIINKQPFCVSARDMARNSSYDCMRAALDLDPNNKGDKKEDRLNYLKERLSDPVNKDVFKQIHEFNYRMCVCDIDSTKAVPDNFSKDLLRLIQLHQTCYGIMNMIGETSFMCKQNNVSHIFPQGFDLTIFQGLKDKISSMEKFGAQSGQPVVANNYSALYKTYIQELKARPTPEYNRLCKGIQPPEAPWKCSGECEIAPDNLKCTLSVTKPDGSQAQSTPITKDFPIKDFLEGGKIKPNTKPKVKVDGNPNEISCDISLKLTCKGKCKIEGDKINCGLTATKPDGSALQERNFQFDKKDYVADDGTLIAGKRPEISSEENNGLKVSCDIEITKDPQPQPSNATYSCESTCTPLLVMTPPQKSCNIIIKKKEGTTESSLEPRTLQLPTDAKVEIEPETGKPKITCTAKAAPASGPKYTCKAKNCSEENEPNEGGKKCELEITKTEEGKEPVTESKGEQLLNADMKYPPAQGVEPVVCTEENPTPKPADNEKTPTLKVTATEKDAKSYTVKADKKDDEGWSFSWFITGETSDVSKDWEPKAETPVAGVPQDGSTTQPSAPAAPGEFVQKRGKSDYQICGKLTKTGKTDIQSCATINKLAEDNKPVVPPQQGGQNMPMPPQPMIRGSSDTSAIGVR